MSDLIQEIQKRKTFGIISHPDAGKTTLTEKLLLFGGAIQEAGAGDRCCKRGGGADRKTRAGVPYEKHSDDSFYQ